MIGGFTELKDFLLLFKYQKFWDPTILVLLGTTIVINFITYNLLIYTK